MKHINQPFFVFAFLFLSCSAFSQPDDRAGVEAAILNYVNALYEADTAKVYESVAPFLAKRGYYTAADGKGREGTMSFEQLVRLAAR